MGNGPEFYQTGMGKGFYDVAIPKITKALESIAFELKRANCLKEKEMSYIESKFLEQESIKEEDYTD